MILKIKHIGLLILLGFTSWAGWSSYTYLFDTRSPQITIHGLEKKQYYTGDILCTMASSKTGEISIWLDSQPLISKFSIAKKEQEQPFEIPTKTIPNGKHKLKAEFTDATFNKNKAIIEREFFVDNVPLQAAFVRPESENKVFQGRTLHLQFQVNKKINKAMVTALSNSYPCFPESKNSMIYEAFIPIACEENPNEYLLSVNIEDKTGSHIRLDNKFQIVVYPFKKQNLNLSAQKVKEEEKFGPDEKEFEKTVEQLTNNSIQKKLWRGSFCTPIDVQQVTTEFGTVRTTQHKGRYAHKAIDVINSPKSVVWASQDGIIVLKDRFEVSGNTVIIDHGCGILSMYYHLDNFAKINAGQKIAKGNPIGTLGNTGYAKGYHLHWEMRLNNIAIDPMQWTKTTF